LFLRNLGQHIGRIPEQVFPARIPVAIQPQVSRMFLQGIKVCIGIGLPLPLEPQCLLRKIIGLADGVFRHSFCRHGPLLHRLPNAVSILVLANKWPVIQKTHGLQMDDSAQLHHILEMDEPVPPVGRCYPAPLVRTVYPGISLVHHHFIVVGPIDRPGSEAGLPSGLHAP